MRTHYEESPTPVPDLCSAISREQGSFRRVFKLLVFTHVINICMIVQFNSRRIRSGHNMAAFSLFKGTNMVAVTSCENRE